MGNAARRMGLINCPRDSAHSGHRQFATKEFRGPLQKHGHAKAILLAKSIPDSRTSLVRVSMRPPRYFHLSSAVLLLTQSMVEGGVIASVIFIVRRISTVTIFPGAIQRIR
jgi:hypothetical protein